jgi:hypothetical protein
VADEEADEDPTGHRMQEGVAYLCEHFARIQSALGGADGQGMPLLLNRLQERVLGSDSPQDVLDAIHEALIAAGDARGIYMRTRGNMTLPGMTASQPPEVIYLCPIMRCRRVVPGPLVIAPRCNLAGTPLRRDRL